MMTNCEYFPEVEFHPDVGIEILAEALSQNFVRFKIVSIFQFYHISRSEKIDFLYFRKGTTPSIELFRVLTCYLKIGQIEL